MIESDLTRRHWLQATTAIGATIAVSRLSDPVITLAAEESATVASILDIGTRRELFVDYKLIDRLLQTRLKLHEPRPAEVAIRIDRPWEGPFNGGCCVFEYEGLYRMYYRGMAAHGGPNLCYAESADGIHWSKPNLGLVDIDGSRDNNVIVADTPNYDIFLDTRPGVAANERIKMTRYSVEGERLTPYFAGKGRKAVHLLASGDGLTFRELGAEPILTCDLPNAFDSHNIFVCEWRRGGRS